MLPPDLPSLKPLYDKMLSWTQMHHQNRGPRHPSSEVGATLYLTMEIKDDATLTQTVSHSACDGCPSIPTWSWSPSSVQVSFGAWLNSVSRNTEF